MDLSTLDCDCLPTHDCEVATIAALPSCTTNGRVYTVTADPDLDRPTQFTCWGGVWVANRFRDGVHAHANLSTNATISSGATQVITFDTEIADIGGMYDEVNNDDKIVTPAERDLWEFLARCQVDFLASIGSVSLTLLINGTPIEVDSDNETADGFLSVVWRSPSAFVPANAQIQVRLQNFGTGDVSVSNINLLVTGRDLQYMTS